MLRSAKDKGKPYHVVHFDGHGTYVDLSRPGAVATVLSGLKSLMLSAPRVGTHGYLLFENPAVDENVELVGGSALGSLLVETDVPVLVLNACRSAHAEAPAEPENAVQAGPASDVHAQVRAFGSLAREVVDAGVAGVVAMRYNVYVYGWKDALNETPPSSAAQVVPWPPGIVDHDQVPNQAARAASADADARENAQWRLAVYQQSFRVDITYGIRTVRVTHIYERFMAEQLAAGIFGGEQMLLYSIARIANQGTP